MKLTENFDREEFECTDGSEMPTDVQLNIAELAVQLEIIRAHFNAPVHINSAYRSLEYNRSIGSNDSSQHVLGRAADITSFIGHTAKYINPDIGCLAGGFL